MSEAEARYDDLTEDEIATLFEAGASPEFVQFAQINDGGRNSVRENADRVLSGRVSEDSDLSVAFGHFGRALWEGDLFNAMKRADGTNTPRLLDLFGLDYINGRSQADGHDGYKMKDGRVVYR